MMIAVACRTVAMMVAIWQDGVMARSTNTRFAVANVVRLAATARRDEVEIMELVGAPFAYVRGPFVTEGILQGGIGAVLAVAALAGLHVVLRSRIGGPFVELTGSGLTFLSPAQIAAMVVGGMALGCIGGYAVARRVR